MPALLQDALMILLLAAVAYVAVRIGLARAIADVAKMDNQAKERLGLTLVVETVIAKAHHSRREYTGTWRGWSVQVLGESRIVLPFLPMRNRTDLLRVRLHDNSTSPGTMERWFFFFHGQRWSCELPAGAPFNMQVLERSIADAPVADTELGRRQYECERKHATVSLGNAELDARFVVGATDALRARAALTQPHVAAQLLAMGHVHLVVDERTVSLDAPFTASDVAFAGHERDGGFLGTWERSLELVTTVAAALVQEPVPRDN